MLLQIALFEKGSQTVSPTCWRVTSALALGLAAAMALSLWPAVPWEPLDFFYLLGYIKVRTTLNGRARPITVADSVRSLFRLQKCRAARCDQDMLAVQVAITVVKYMPQVPASLRATTT